MLHDTHRQSFPTSRVYFAPICQYRISAARVSIPKPALAHKGAGLHFRDRPEVVNLAAISQYAIVGSKKQGGFRVRSL